MLVRTTHTPRKQNVQVEAAQKYLDNGAQPSPRVVKLLKDAGVKLPKWVKQPAADKQKTIKNSEKLRKNQPKEEVVEATTEEVAPDVAEEAPTEAPVEEAHVEVEAPTEEAPAKTEE
jgi:hypothetical protein